MIPGLPGISDLLGRAIDAATGSVFDGIVTWMARGLGVLIEWIWTTLDNATTPRITEPWFVTGLVKPIGLLALAVTIALMLASAIQAALAGRPEQIFDAFKQGAWTLVATGLTVTVMDLLLGVVDQASAGIWDQARPDLQHLLEGVISVMSTSVMSGMGFLAVLMMLLMYFALIGLAVTLAMRNALIYVTAVMAPVVFASSVLPLFRESSRKIIHLGVALIISKLAIVVTLTLAVKMMANATNIAATGDQVHDGAGALGLLFAGVTCFAVASITPMVLYKLMPTVEGAVIGAGIAGGWGRGAMTGMYAASTAKNLGGSVAKLAGGQVPGGGSGGGGGSQSASPATMPTSGASGASSAGGGASASGGAASGAGGAGGGAAAAAVAAPVMVATAGISAVKSGISKVTETAGATADAAGSSASRGSSSPVGEAQAAKEGATSSGEGSPSTQRVPSAATGES